MPSEVPDPIWGRLLLQAFLILLNAFFSAAEIAIISLSENKIKRYADPGDVKADDILQMVQSPPRFLSTILICGTLAGFLASAFAASNFAGSMAGALARWGVTSLSYKTLESVCVILIIVILSFFTLVFGELVPKRIAMRFAYKVARFSVGVIRALTVVLRPAVALLTFTTNAVLRLLHVPAEGEDEEVTEENIRMLVDMGEEKGVIEAGEAELIENIFEFNNQTAQDVMVHRTDVTALSMADSQEEIMRTIRETGFSRFPVYDEDIDDVVGTLSTREYLLNQQEESPKPLRDLIRPAYFVPETVHADVLFRDMQKNKTHLAVVVDEYGGTSGIVTMEDLLEEIVGDIFDEFDPMEETAVVQLEPNLWRVSGSVDLETLGEALGVELPLDDEYDTLGGLVYSQMSAIPEDGATPVVEAFGLLIQVEKIEDRRVDSALICKKSLLSEKEPEV